MESMEVFFRWTGSWLEASIFISGALKEASSLLEQSRSRGGGGGRVVCAFCLYSVFWQQF